MWPSKSIRGDDYFSLWGMGSIYTRMNPRTTRAGKFECVIQLHLSGHSKSNRRELWPYDCHLYKKHNEVKRLFH